jgi:hypothetical protein
MSIGIVKRQIKQRTTEQDRDRLTGAAGRNASGHVGPGNDYFFVVGR